MSDQNPAAPGPPDPADAAEAVSEAAAPVENAPQAAAEHVTETVEAPVAEAVTEVVEAPAAPVPATPPPAFDAGSVPPPPPPPPPGYAAPAAATIPVFPNGKPMLDATGQPVSDKSRLAAALLCWFVGVFGVHRFYVGKVGTGVAMLVTCGGLGVWALIDLVVILLGSFRDQEGRALQNW
jgi:hypothetical protein